MPGERAGDVVQDVVYVAAAAFGAHADKVADIIRMVGCCVMICCVTARAARGVENEVISQFRNSLADFCANWFIGQLDFAA